jgi:hypothetical protein
MESGMAKLTITFRGLCLFMPAPSNTPTRIHVFLAQPEGMPHVSIRRYLEADGSWTADELVRWVSLSFGTEGTPATMPDKSTMSSFTPLMKAPRLPEKKAREGASMPPTWKPHDHRGSHVILHGGTLVAKEPIGVWKDRNNQSSNELFFPYILEWTGEATTGATLQFWNTIPKEAPSLGRNSVEKQPDPNDDHVAMAKHHFKAFYHVLNGTYEPDLTMTRTIPEPPPEEKGKLRIRSLIVSSCPSGGGDGDP